jgi:hypothetical protein
MEDCTEFAQHHCAEYPQRPVFINKKPPKKTGASVRSACNKNKRMALPNAFGGKLNFRCPRFVP